jgi:DNA-binding beta-propeller fold protein YncE
VQFFSNDGRYLGKWGGPGKEPGEFHGPADIAFGPLGTVFVVDYNNSRIQNFTTAGEYIGEWRCKESRYISFGSIAITADGTKYLLDDDAGKIMFFDGDYKFLGSWGKMGSGLGEVLYPGGIAVGPNGDVFVADNYNHRIQQFTAEGSFVSAWGNDGLGPGEFHYPAGIAVAADGTVYVADTGNSRIQYFRPVPAEDN